MLGFRRLNVRSSPSSSARFGAKSLERVRFLLSNFLDRYDPLSEALGVLQRWRSMDAAARQVHESPYNANASSIKMAVMERSD
jgi:hypothetical protein